MSPLAFERRPLSPIHWLTTRQGRTFTRLLASSTIWVVLCGNGPEAPPSFLLKWGSVGTAPGQFQLPHGLAVGDDGLVYVADWYNNRIQVFARDGAFVRAWADGLDLPTGIAVAKGGYVYVDDSFHDAIKVFTRDGGLVTAWGGYGRDAGHLDRPQGVAVDDSGYVYVADTGNQRIQKFTAMGEFVRMWSASGAADLSYVLGLATFRGYLYAVNGSVALVNKYTTTGELVSTFGAYPFLDSPNYVATDAAGNVYVTDADHHRVVKFDPNGKELTHWGPGGDGPCQFLNPSGIAIDADGNIYVSDPWGQVPVTAPACIQKFGSTSSPAVPRTWGSLKVRYR